MKYKLEDLKIGMKVKKEELEEIKYVWILVKYEKETDEYGTLILFEKDNFDKCSYDTREKIANYIRNTKMNEDGSYAEFWGVYLNIDKDIPFETFECYFYQVFDVIMIPKGKYSITAKTSFGLMTSEDGYLNDYCIVEDVI